MTNLLEEIWSLPDRVNTLPWQPFRPGIEIHRLYGDEIGPSAALLRYQPGAQVPHHSHTGYEHIVVLSGSQRDERGLYQTGAFVINPPGSAHTVTSDNGCLVLIIWEKSVVIEEAYTSSKF
ncbi:MAG: transcription negative regulator ChrR [Leptolyngbya sp. SIO1D8]|nr:transcription negative regulator ChrR [Leptolyngbya sp. SIO1D8]